jgi:glycosyltransferase involved in cell wall biosynthesis
MPKVSIIMPAYNAGKTIKEAVDSILKQTFSDFELIICDDASKDNTPIVLANINDHRIKVIHNSFNQGTGISRDHAIDLAIGKWLSFADADDVWLPNRLEILLKAIGTAKNILVFDDLLECHDTPNGLIGFRTIHGGNKYRDNDKEYVDIPTDKFILSKRLVMQPIIPIYIVKENKIKHSTKRFGEDTEYFLKILSYNFLIRYVGKPLYKYRITPGSATSESMRCTMMREILEDAIGLFNNSPNIQTALRTKIAMMVKEEQYVPFVLQLKKKKFYSAFKTTINSPWVILEFSRRLGFSLYYHAHRIYHGGRTRGIR